MSWCNDNGKVQQMVWQLRYGISSFEEVAFDVLQAFIRKYDCDGDFKWPAHVAAANENTRTKYLRDYCIQNWPPLSEANQVYKPTYGPVLTAQGESPAGALGVRALGLAASEAIVKKKTDAIVARLNTDAVPRGPDPMTLGANEARVLAANEALKKKTEAIVTSCLDDVRQTSAALDTGITWVYASNPLRPELNQPQAARFGSQLINSARLYSTFTQRTLISRVLDNPNYALLYIGKSKATPENVAQLQEDPDTVRIRLADWKVDVPLADVPPASITPPPVPTQVPSTEAPPATLPPTAPTPGPPNQQSEPPEVTKPPPTSPPCVTTSGPCASAGGAAGAAGATGTLGVRERRCSYIGDCVMKGLPMTSCTYCKKDNVHHACFVGKHANRAEEMSSSERLCAACAQP